MTLATDTCRSERFPVHGQNTANVTPNLAPCEGVCARALVKCWKYYTDP